MDTEWAVQQVCKDVRAVVQVTPQQEAEFRLRVRSTLKKWQTLGQTHAEQKHITILLSDIRGFTAIAETYSAMLVVDMLNRYFSCMCQIIVNYGGTIDKFMGDSIMVLFGAPAGKPDDVERAIACAVEMQLAMSDINAQNRALDMPELFMASIPAPLWRVRWVPTCMRNTRSSVMRSI
jgi:adenylate cyclase